MADRTTAPLLLLTSDPALAVEVLRLAAAAAVPVDVAERPAQGLTDWVDASTVLIGSDAAAEVATLGPPRRDGVHLVGLGEADDTTYRLAVAVGAASVLELPAAEEWLAGLLADVGDGGIGIDGGPAGVGAGAVVGVVGGSGGAGASVLAAALAATAGQDGPAALLDLDPFGPGLHRVLGHDVLGHDVLGHEALGHEALGHDELGHDVPGRDVGGHGAPALGVPGRATRGHDAGTGITWADLAGSRGRLGSRSLREALPRRDGVGVLGWPSGSRPAVVPHPLLLREVVTAAARGHRWVVLDLPRAHAPELADALVHCHHVLVVSRASVCHVAAAAKVAERVADAPARPGLVVRMHRGSATGDQVARALGLPLLAELPEQRRLDEHLDLGAGPVHLRRSPLARVAGGLLDALAEHR